MFVSPPPPKRGCRAFWAKSLGRPTLGEIRTVCKFGSFKIGDLAKLTIRVKRLIFYLEIKGD